MISKTLSTIVAHNIYYYIPLYKKYLHGCKKIIDIGSGNGMQAKLLLKHIKNIHLTCLDVSNYLWEENKDLNFTVYNGKVIPFPKGSFDASLLFFVLHHTTDPVQMLSEAKRVSRKRILIFEEVFTNPLQKLLMIVYDMLVNTLVLGETITLPHFRTSSQWKLLFRKLSLENVEEVKFPRKWYYPPQRILFIVNL